MALTERQEQKLEILPNGMIQVQDITVIERDGAEINRLFHRKVIDVDDDITTESPRIKAIAPEVWTDEIKSARAAKKEV